MPLADMRAVAQEMEKSLYDLALHSQSDGIRLQASQALIEICERREAEQRPVPKSANIDSMIAEIAALAPRRTQDLEAADESAPDYAAGTTAVGSDD
jgi:hypothetical protein